MAEDVIATEHRICRQQCFEHKQAQKLGNRNLYDRSLAEGYGDHRLKFQFQYEGMVW